MRYRVRSAAVAALTATAVAVGAPGAWAADVTGEVINAVQVNKWTPPSSDPSGLAVASGGNLTITDGEVEETTFYQDANVFHSTRSGDLVSTSDTTGFSNEPTGIAYGPNGTIIVSDDDLDQIILVDGFDDTSPIRISTTRFMTDPEGVAYDTFRNDILIANGEGGAGFVRYSAGPDKAFGTTDDVAGTKISPAGAADTEGVAYDSVRDTVLLLDSGASEKIYEMTADGTVINTISLANISGLNQPAGIEVAAATSGGGSRSYYIVDRGQDPGTTSSVNDGMMYEVQATGLTDAGPGVNQPPTANAGPDKVITLGESLSLSGSGSDPEGTPVSYAWTETSGPGDVKFTPSDAAATTATFSAAGQYVLRLTVTDGDGASDWDEVKVTVTEPGGTTSLEIPIAMSSDDAREGGTTSPTFVDTGTKTNDLGRSVNDAYVTKTGVRFDNIPVPEGGEIVSARIQFMADTVASTGGASLTIVTEAADDAATYANVAAAKVSARAYGTGEVTWAPPEWTAANERAEAQLTPELKTIVQEVIDRAGWTQGNAVAFKIEGTGRRIARSYDSATGTSGNRIPVLHLQFTMGSTPPPAENTAPVVNAGSDMEVTMPAAANLDGTVSDDGKPAPTTVQWSKVSGPGAVTFGDDTTEDTTATFGSAGDYVLRLTADDSLLTGMDEVLVKVAAAPSDGGGGTGGGGGGGGTGGGGSTNTAPTVNAGADRAVTLPAGLALDATVSDDGKPGPTTVKWSKVSGPGSVTFADANAVDTEVSFSAPGVYTLRLTADDTLLTGHDELIVTVEEESDGDLTVSLRGPAKIVKLGREIGLRGIVSLDGGTVAGEAVRVYVRRTRGAPFELLSVTSSRADGTFMVVDEPYRRSVYRATVDGDRSARVVVRVKSRLTAHVRDAVVGSGERTAVVGWISPTVEGQRVVLQRWDGDRWRRVETISLPDSARLRYRFPVTHDVAGVMQYRVVVPRYDGIARAVAPRGDRLRIEVRD